MKKMFLVMCLFIVGGAYAFMTSPAEVSTHTYVLRLTPGEDPKVVVNKFLQEKKITSAMIISGLGSLSQTVLRFANEAKAVTLKGPREVLTFSGSVSINGNHLHVSVSDSKGNVVGGHLAEGSKVFTTLELVIMTFPDLVFERKKDPATSFEELTIRKK